MGLFNNKQTTKGSKITNPKNPKNPKGSILKNKYQTPTFDKDIYNNIPTFLKEITGLFKDQREKDIVLLGSIVVLGSCMSNVFSLYRREKLYPNLNLFIAAGATGNKGIVKNCKELVVPIHDDLMRKNVEINTRNNDANRRNVFKILIYPANITSTSVIETLYNNDGIGLIFETEGDTLSKSFGSKYGDFSDTFRKTFHHETVSYLRRGNNGEYVEVLNPKLSSVFTGTHKQIMNLIPEVENGLFSRFLFYIYDRELVWNSSLESDDIDLHHEFTKLGNIFFEFYIQLKKLPNIRFRLSKTQLSKLDQYLDGQQTYFYYRFGEDAVATIRRFAIIFIRIAMILSILKEKENKKISQEIECKDNIFEITFSMIKTFLEHSKKVFLLFPGKKIDIGGSKILEDFYYELPNKFNREDYIKVAKGLGIIDKTAQHYMSILCSKKLIIRLKHNLYNKPA